MAPARATRKAPPREEDYSNIGVAGRKTGITLKDSGIRDEHGLEPIDGIFSSPERPRSTRKTNGNISLTITDEESMEIGQSTIPEPTEILNNRRITLPPPRSRSPMKTNLGSSPRRSVGPPSSPSKQLQARSANGAGSAQSSPRAVRPSPLRSVGRMSRDPDDSIAAVSPMKSAKRKQQPTEKAVAALQLVNNKRRKVFDINVTDDEGADETADSSRMEETLNASVEDSGLVNAADDSLPVDASEIILDESMLDQQQDIEQEAENELDSNIFDIQDEESEAEVAPARAIKRKAGRPKKGELQSPSTADSATIAPQKPAAKTRRGRPPKNKAPEISEPELIEEEIAETIEERPAKKEAPKSQPPTSPKTRKKPPPSQRRRGARVSSSGEAAKPAAAAAPPQQAESSTSFERGKPRSRGLLMMRSETPAGDQGAQVLRSGRTSVKPLAYWRSEKIVYGDSRKEGDRLSLPGIKEIIRTEEMPAPPSRRRGAARTGPKPGRRRAQPDIEEEDEDAEPWELDTGVAGGDVMTWDAINQRVSEHDLEEIELAYAPKGLNGLMREVKNATFLYGKTVTLPFFHSGIVDLPPGGEKRMKNSRKNHMVFWVFTGRVDVNVSNNEFSVGAGAMWQVPRGNFYSLQNPYSRPSRVFFAQGCYMDGKEEDRLEGGAGGGGGGGAGQQEGEQ